ncbi:DUF4124 domain-containing protein [Neptunomonas marina]|nr:DUF4124 domain-containing protein [Neptunomonas marina]
MKGRLDIKTQVLAIAMAATLPLSAHAEIYRWVDENGKAHYSDRKPEDANVKVERKVYQEVATPFRRPPEELYRGEAETLEDGEDPTPDEREAKVEKGKKADNQSDEKSADTSDEEESGVRNNKRHVAEGENATKLVDKQIQRINRNERISGIKEKNQKVLKEYRDKRKK